MKIFILCPIPEENKPMNQYITFKENINLNWILFCNEIYNPKMFLLYILPWLFLFIKKIVGLFQTTNYSLYFIFFLYLAILFSFFLFLFSEIKKNFHKSYFLYEEGSWYEIQRWQKPVFLIKNDRLLHNQRMSIIQKRTISYFCFSCLFLLFY